MEWMDIANRVGQGSVGSPEGIRAGLSPLLGSPLFNWLVPVVHRTLDEFLVEAFQVPAADRTGDGLPLDGDPPLQLEISAHRYSPFQFEENVSVANDMVNRLLTRRAELHALERQAIEAALGYCEQSRLLKADAVLERVALEASFAALGREPDAESLAALQERQSSRTEALTARIALHNMAGSPTNFGEQVTFMRRIYADNVRILSERMSAISAWLRMSLSFGSHGDIPHPTDPRFLDDTVDWVRQLVQDYEEVERDLQRSTVYIDVLATALSSRTAEEGQALTNNFLQTGEIEFELKPFASETLYLNGGVVRYQVDEQQLAAMPPLPLWMVGLSAAICAQQPRPYPVPTDNAENDRKGALNTDNAVLSLRSLSFPVQVQPPTQADALSTAKTVDLGLVPFRVNEPVADDLKPLTAGAAQRFYPFGVWRVQVGPSVPNRSSKTPEASDTLPLLGLFRLILAIEIEGVVA